MAGKSRRGRGRHLPRSKRKGRKVFSAPAAQVYEPAPEAEKPVPSAKTPTPRATVAATRATNISAELRRIGLLAGIMLVILVVLALIFA
jgi:hypothetical protein